MPLKRAFVVTLILVSACSATNTSVARIPLVTPTVLPSIVTPTDVEFTNAPSEALFIPTLALPDENINLYASPNQLTDGVLSIDLTKTEEKCFKPGKLIPVDNNRGSYIFGELIPLLVTFHNLTKQSLLIADYTIIAFPSTLTPGATGKLLPILSDIEGNILTTWEESQSRGDYSSYSNARTFLEISPDSLYDYPIKFTTPSEILYVNGEGEQKFLPISPGKYLLKYIYISSGYKSSWKGKTVSNQVEICISE